MGQVAGEVVAAAFGCFNPKVVVPAIETEWQITSREAILDAGERAATAMLQRILGQQPEGLGRVTDLLRRGADAARWEGRATALTRSRPLAIPATSTDAWAHPRTYTGDRDAVPSADISQPVPGWRGWQARRGLAVTPGGRAVSC